MPQDKQTHKLDRSAREAELERLMQRSHDRQQRLVRAYAALSQVIAITNEEEELYRRVAALVKDQLGYNHAQMFRYDSAQEAAILVAGTGRTGRQMLDEGYRVQVGNGPVGMAAGLGTSVLCPNVADDPAYRPHACLVDAGGELAVPIKLDQWDAHAQVMAVRGFVGGDFDGFVAIVIDEAGATPVFREALDEGLCIVSTNPLFENDLTAEIRFADYENGYLLGERAGQWARQHLSAGETLQLAMFDSPPLAEIVQREAGIMDGIRSVYPNVRLLETAVTASPARTMPIARRWLETWPDLHMILGINDSGALGAYAAAVASGKNKASEFFIGGIDATDEALAAINDGGAFQVTIDQSPREVGVLTVRTLVAAIVGQPHDRKRVISGTAIDRSNLRAFLAQRQTRRSEDGGVFSDLDLSGIRIGMNVIDLQNPFFVQMAEAAMEEARRLGVDLLVNDSRQVLAVLSVQSNEVNALGTEDQLALEGFCGQVATAVKSLRLFAELKEAHDLLEARVQERTAELRQEIVERERVEQTLRESQERYRILFDSASDAVFVHDLEGRFLDVNQVACEHLGYSREELLQIDPHALDAPDDGASVEDRIEVLRQQGAAVFELAHVRKDGSSFPVELSSRLIDYGGVPAVISIARDVTERRQAQEALLQASRMEVAATLSGGIAHKVNNLMGGVLGYAELLREELADRPELWPDLQTISRSAEEASQLAQQMLAFARGRVAQLEGLNLNSVVRAIVGTQESALPAGVRIVLDLAPDLWEVSADPRQIGQAFLNVLVNAVEAISGDGQVTVVTHNVAPGQALPEEAEPGAYVSLVVEDTGQGMTPEVLARSCEPFYTTKFQGRGLGLAATYGIVQSHGGQLVLDSQEGIGTRVALYFSAVQPEMSSVSTVEQRGEPAGPPTVLLVEDNETVRRFVCRLLDREGYQVLAARGGEEAVDLARGHPGAIDLMLLDIEMPGMDGVEAYPLLTEARPEAKIILCSGYDVGEREQALLEAGASGFLLKPFDRQSLCESLRAALGDGS